MATTIKKKSSAKKKPALKKKQNKVSPYLIAIGAIVIAIIGAIIVRGSFASIKYWPVGTASISSCGYTIFNAKRVDMQTLGRGSRGDCVVVLQAGLKKTGFMASTSPADGIFGSRTGDSVLLLQTYYKLRTRDRVVGRCTWYALQGAAIYGRTNISKVQTYVKAQEAAKRLPSRCF